MDFLLINFIKLTWFFGFMDHNGFYRNKNILVTGGYGFRWSNLVCKLVRLGANVTVVDSFLENTSANKKNLEEVEGKFEYIAGDLCDSKVADTAVQNKDLIFHLAGNTVHGISMSNPKLDLDVNVLCTINILNACKINNKNTKIIFTSTRQVYGKPNYLPVDEKHGLNPPDVNAINKIAAENYLLLYDNVYGIKSLIFRLTNTYGPKQSMKLHLKQLVPTFVRLAMEEKDITVYGNGAELRDLNFVDDVIDALLIGGASELHGEIFNLGDTNYKSLLDMAKDVIDVSGKGSYKLVPFPDERKKINVGDTYLDISKIKNVLGWQPKTGFKDGVKRTLEYFKGKEEHYF